MPELIQTRREADGRWRWVYLETDEDVELQSSELYESPADAEAAAASLYPGVHMETSSPPTERSDSGEVTTSSATLLRRAATSAVLLAALLWGIKLIGRRSGAS